MHTLKVYRFESIVGQRLKMLTFPKKLYALFFEMEGVLITHFAIMKENMK